MDLNTSAGIKYKCIKGKKLNKKRDAFPYAIEEACALYDGEIDLDSYEDFYAIGQRGKLVDFRNPDAIATCRSIEYPNLHQLLVSLCWCLGISQYFTKHVFEH